MRRRVEAILISEHRWTREEAARTLSEVARSHVETDLRTMLSAAEAGAGEKRDEVFE